MKQVRDHVVDEINRLMVGAIFQAGFLSGREWVQNEG